jgi:hypothetical protein
VELLGAAQRESGLPRKAISKDKMTAEIEMGNFGREESVCKASAKELDVNMTPFQRFVEKLSQTMPTFTSIDHNDLREMGIAPWLASCHLLLYCVVLVYFLVSGTANEYSKKYLSLTTGSSKTASCNKIPLDVTGVFLADENGIWDSAKQFIAARPIYKLTMTVTTVTDED